MLMLAALWLGGCSWVELAWNALTYPTTRSGESANVVVHGEWAYVKKGAAGIEVVHLGRREPTRVVPVQGGGSTDDLAVADGLLFVLDARPPGHLTVYTLEDPSAPTGGAGERHFAFQPNYSDKVLKARSEIHEHSNWSNPYLIRGRRAHAG